MRPLCAGSARIPARLQEKQESVQRLRGVGPAYAANCGQAFAVAVVGAPAWRALVTKVPAESVHAGKTCGPSP